jgi:hypothetical protein
MGASSAASMILLLTQLAPFFGDSLTTINIIIEKYAYVDDSKDGVLRSV